MQISAQDSTRAELFQVWVAPECRGHGGAHALLEHALAWAAAQGVQSVVLGVACGDSPAMRLYRRLSFRAQGEPEPMRPGAPQLSQTMLLDFTGIKTIFRVEAARRLASLGGAAPDMANIPRRSSERAE